LSDTAGRGFTVTEMAPMDQAIEVSTETVTAFVGRALRGPVNVPVLVRSVGEFRRRFGEVWSRSSLGPAVQDFFEHGGNNLHVVRVANNARGAMICLAASGSALILRALEPGSTENIRAAIDYDGIEPDDDLFNLTLQRVDPGTGRIIDQEMFRDASHSDNSHAFIGDRLLTSSLVQMESPYPGHRPEPTVGSGGQFAASYVGHAQKGTDGSELSDYDLIGSRRNETGLFALQQIEQLDILYLPPPGKGRDLGPAAVLVAERYCGERGAMLVVDPVVEWVTATGAIHGVRDLGYASPNMVGYFPRVYRRDGDDSVARAAGGALAGLLCKLDRCRGPWQDLDQQGMGLDRNLIAAVDIDESDARSLARAGINALVKGPAGKTRLTGSVTMGRGAEAHREYSSLAVRRLCLRIVNAIDHGTRWAMFEADETELAARVHSQVFAYLCCLDDLGAFENDRFVVQCNAGMRRRMDGLKHGVTILLEFHPVGCDEPISFTLHQTVSGCRVARTAFPPVIDDCA